MDGDGGPTPLQANGQNPNEFTRKRARKRPAGDPSRPLRVTIAHRSGVKTAVFLSDLGAAPGTKLAKSGTVVPPDSVTQHGDMITRARANHLADAGRTVEGTAVASDRVRQAFTAAEEKPEAARLDETATRRVRAYVHGEQKAAPNGRCAPRRRPRGARGGPHSQRRRSAASGANEAPGAVAGGVQAHDHETCAAGKSAAPGQAADALPTCIRRPQSPRPRRRRASASAGSRWSTGLGAKRGRRCVSWHKQELHRAAGRRRRAPRNLRSRAAAGRSYLDVIFRVPFLQAIFRAAPPAPPAPAVPRPRGRRAEEA